MLDLIMQFLDNIFLGMAIAWEMGTVEAIYNQFVIYNQAYFSTGLLPTEQTISEFSARIHDLTVVKEYCGDINVLDMIQAEVPFEELKYYCDFPEGLDEEMASRFI
jgi:hypothetical protein